MRPALTLVVGSAALMAGALAFQYIGGYPPCALCHWQRWAHLAVIPLGLAALAAPARVRDALTALALAALLAGVAIAIYHVGVEQKLWAGPATCSGAPSGSMSLEALREQLLAAPVIRCDDIAWSLLGVSMAGWNAIASLAVAALAVALWRRSPHAAR